MSCWLTARQFRILNILQMHLMTILLVLGRLAAEYVDESCSNVDNQPINYNINQSSDTFLKLSPISVDSVASTLRGLKACKATGLDKIPAKILKLSANIIAPSLTFIFNLSLATGVYS